jgi:hypothetical protein
MNKMEEESKHTNQTIDESDDVLLDFVNTPTRPRTNSQGQEQQRSSLIDTKAGGNQTLDAKK